MSRLEILLEQMQRQIDAQEQKIELLEAVEFVQASPWTDYTDISTVVGWSSFTNKKIFYKKIGQLVFVKFYLEGTSNSTSATFTLPFAKDTGSLTILQPCFAQDNGGAFDWGTISLIDAASLVNLYPDLALGGWTASGAKTCVGQFLYEAA